MLGGHKGKGKSSPINLVTPGDVVSAQQLLRVEQDSRQLFLTRGYNSYSFVGLYGVMAVLAGGSCAWIGVDRDVYPEGRVFAGLEGLVSVLAVVEVLWRLGLTTVCEYWREPLHWVDLTLLVLWFTGLGLLQTGQFKYQELVLAVHAVFLGRALVLGGNLVRQLRVSSRYETPNLNILNISQMPGEVEVIVLDESGNNSQPSQVQHEPAGVRVDKHLTYFSPKHQEAGQKLEIED